jgi:hypothetical protein
MRNSKLFLSLLFLLIWFARRPAQLSAADAAAVAPPEVWEYAELEHRSRRVAANQQVSGIRWSTSTSVETIGTDWKNVAQTLKIPAPKDDPQKNPTASDTDTMFRLLVLNHFGLEGWEMCGYTRTDSPMDIWYFKRRVGK